jgi:D-serine dehydratase
MPSAPSEPLLDLVLDATVKGFPAGAPPVALRDVAARGWNVFRGDLGSPVLVLRRAAVDHNRRWMTSFVARHGALLAPHGKTTMAPQLWRRQLEDGAWGITVANAHQAAVGLRHGFRRLVLASEVVNPAELAWLQRVLDDDPGVEIVTLVDAEEGVGRIERCASGKRRIPVLVEVGIPGARAGCRGVRDALAVARRAAASPAVELRGFECFEGIAPGEDPEARAAAVRSWLADLSAAAAAARDEGLLAPGVEPWITAGGSAFFDLVASGLSSLAGFRLVLRSGCYLVHDDGLYAGLVAGAEARMAVPVPARPVLRPALELWAEVLSRPEPGLAILNAGKRDFPQDAGLAVPRRYLRTGDVAPRAISGWRLAATYDQHVQLWTPPGEEPAIGDRVGLGVSHPCTTFDRWQVLFEVAEDGAVLGAVRTFF